jgi:hypothetical protein
VQQVILQPRQVEQVVLVELRNLLRGLEAERFNISFRIHEDAWLARHRQEMFSYAAWLGVLEQLRQGVPLEKIFVPAPLPVLGVLEPKVPPGPWLDFGLTATQWQMSIHDVLMRSTVVGSAAASGAISKVGINTVGGFYVIWGGDDEKISSGIIPNFGLARLQIVKQALKEAKISWPVWAKISAAKVQDLSGNKPWEDFIVTEAQWGMPLTDVLVGDSRGNTHQPSRVRNILAKAGCVTVGELYLFCQGRKTALLELSGMSETRLIVLDNAMKAAGIPLLNQ